MDLVLYHHNHTKSNYPDLCSILKKADHHSASEREDIDDTQEVNKTPLISLFSKIVLEGNGKVDEQYIPLNKLSLDDGSFNNLKPAAKKDTMGGWNLVPEYNRLWDEFNSEFELIQNKTDFNTLLALLKKYASTMPSAAYKSKSDISLYDHSKTTAALAVSRYLFNRDGDVKLTQKDDLNCYLAIEGDISGIQKFIFKISSPQEAQSGMSKRLRGRSLYLTLLCDAIATYIAEELELCEANILFCGGGRFTIIGPETWYKLTTKALLDTGQYDKCINLSTEALLNLSEFTYDNDVWFKWRIAKSFNQLGEYDQSVDYLNDIKQFKNDWFIDNLMAENYFFKNDWDNALKYALSAALAKGDTDKKVNLYSLIEDILNKKNKQKEADIHAYLVYTIRKRHNWNIDENLEYKIEKAGFDLDNEDYFTIEKHLHHLWEEYLYKNQELKKGVIVSVLPNKKAGFIRCDEYPDNLYFSMNEFKHNITLAKTGQNVTFYEADGFDKKKNKQVKNAVNIYLNGG